MKPEGLDVTTSTWVKLQRRYCIMLAKVVFMEADTSTIRLILAWASALYALSLGYHTLLGSALFERPAYALMAMVGNEWFWAFLFMLHWAGVHWRVLDPIRRNGWGLAVNTYGLFLWLYSTLCISVALGALLPSSSIEWTMIAASAWALFRTGWNEKVSA